MTTSAAALAPKRRLHFSALASEIFAATAIVALLDGLYAVVVFAWILGATTSTRIFQGIASALVGRAAASAGGLRTTVLGLALHVLVALAWTIVWAIVYSRSARVRELVRDTSLAIITGILYGALVHLAMQLLVLPMTPVGRGALLGKASLLVLLAHLTVVGPPIVLTVRRPAARL